MKIFGKDNASKSQFIKDKKSKTFLKNYGVDNIFKAKSFKEHLNKIMYSKYGRLRNNGWHNGSDEQKEYLWRCLNENFTSKIEKRIVSILIEMGMSFTHTFFIKGLSFDICCGKYIIEVNGDFWHANPKLFNGDDILHFPKQEQLASDLWLKDLKKKKVAEKEGYVVHYIWESEIRNLSDTELIKRLSFLNENKKNNQN